MKAMFVYVAGIHQSYINLFKKHFGIEFLGILGSSFSQKFRPLGKNINAIDPFLIKAMISSLKIFKRIEVVEENFFTTLTNFDSFSEIIFPKEEEMIAIAEEYLSGKNVVFEKDFFLRHDRDYSLKQQDLSPDIKISRDDFDRRMISFGLEHAEKSSDIWRHIGSVLVKEKEIAIITFNHHLLSSHAPHLFCDPRNNFKKGIHIELSSFIHSEAGVIASAAKNGISTNGASIYVSTFPCGPCTYLIAESGIKKLFYSEGYGVLDGEDILKKYEIETIFVDMSF
ncbi:MAG: deaminase [Candidatus Paceibacterota bacterium]|jgi:dCMP deaminase